MKFLSKRLVKWGLIPIILLSIWAVLTVVYVKKTSGLNILTYKYHKNEFKPFKSSRILKGEILRAEIKSKAKNLGIISVRFNNFDHISDDIMIYRVREKGQKNWYYQNQHSVGQFQPHGLFTFGFPLIPYSEGKVYQFELESKKGTPKESVALSILEPVLVTKHEYGREALMTNKDLLREFIFRKIDNLITDTDFIVSSLIYILPLLFYVLTFIFFEKPGKFLNRKVSYFQKEQTRLKGQFKLVSIPLLFTILDVVFVSQINHTILIVITSVWIFILINFKLDSRISFVASLFFLGLSPFLLIVHLEAFAEKAALWAYMFLLVGTVHQIGEIRKSSPSKKSSSSV